MMATAGTPHFSAFEARAEAAREGFPWIDEPQLWQNCASGLSFVPQSLQNRAFAAGVLVAITPGCYPMQSIAARGMQ